MVTDKQVEAACYAYFAQMTADGFPVEDRRISLAGIRSALEAAEKAAWLPISEIPDDETLMVLAEGVRGFMVWRARMLYWQQHGKTPAHLQFGATRFRVIGKFDAPISGPLPKGPSDE